MCRSADAVGGLPSVLPGERVRDRLAKIFVTRFEYSSPRRHECGGVRFLVRKQDRGPVRRLGKLGLCEHRAPVSGEHLRGIRHQLLRYLVPLGAVS